MYRFHTRPMEGFGGGRWYRRRSVKGFIEWVNETQSFTHLTDDVIRGWLKGRFEIEVFGERKKSSAFYVDVTCSKCKGRGWFGRGRRDCPECVSVGKKATRKVRRWKGGEKFTGREKRELIWSERSIGLLDDASSEVKYAEAFDRAANHSELYCPAWVDDVQITGEHTDKDRAKYLERIKGYFTFSKIKPKVRGVVNWQREICDRNIDPDETIIRLAMTFGCTCPITGEYIPPDQVATIGGPLRHEDMYDLECGVSYMPHMLVAPLGFSAHKWISRWRPCGSRTYNNCVYPFSKMGIKVIRNAAKKCLKVMDGKIDDEWVLAEIMQSAILKRAA